MHVINSNAIQWFWWCNTHLISSVFIQDAFYFPCTKLDTKIKKIFYLWKYLYMLMFLIFCISLCQNIWKNKFLLHLPIKGWIKDSLELMTALAKHRALSDCYAHFSSLRAKPEYWFWFPFFFLGLWRKCTLKCFALKCECDYQFCTNVCSITGIFKFSAHNAHSWFRNLNSLFFKSFPFHL